VKKIIVLIISLFLFLYGKNEIKSFDWSNNEFIVTFKKNLGKVHAWNFYHKGSKQYKYIYDIDNAVVKEGVLKVKDKKFVDNIIIGQYKANKLRISFRNKEKLHLQYRVRKNKIIFDFRKKKKKSKKKRVKKRRSITKSPSIIKYHPKSKTINRKGKIVVIDPGHGGKDGGAVNKKKKIREKDIVLSIAKYTAEYLRNMGYIVYLTRKDDYFITLRNRTKFANKKKADLFVSIHANSLPRKGNYSKKNGIETYYLSKNRSKRAERVAAKENSGYLKDVSKIGKINFLKSLNRAKIIQSHKLAIDIQTNIVKRLRKYYYHIEDGGVKGAPFWVLVGAQMPAVLIEVGYVTGNRDSKRLLDRLYKKRLAKGIALGVKDYFKKN